MAAIPPPGSLVISVATGNSEREEVMVRTPTNWFAGSFIVYGYVFSRFISCMLLLLLLAWTMQEIVITVIRGFLGLCGDWIWGGLEGKDSREVIRLKRNGLTEISWFEIEVSEFRYSVFFFVYPDSILLNVGTILYSKPIVRQV